MMTHTSLPLPPGRERGATLLISLVMLVVLTLFAVTGFNLSSVNLRIAGNFQMQRTMEAAAQRAIEEIISSGGSFGLTPTATQVCVDGGSGCAGGILVDVSAPVCNYVAAASGYTKKIGEIPPEDTDWEFRASTAVDALSGASASITQGVRVRLLAGNCP